jgi:hypothetical protein
MEDRDDGRWLPLPRGHQPRFGARGQEDGGWRIGMTDGGRRCRVGINRVLARAARRIGMTVSLPTTRPSSPSTIHPGLSR